MKTEEMMAELEKFNNKYDDIDYQRLKDTTNEILSYLTHYNKNIQEIMNKSLLNALKLDEENWGKIQSKYYFDFFQVRDKDTKQLKHTYTINKYNGLTKRGYCMKSDWAVDLDELKEFLANDDAVNSLTKLAGYEELINTIKDIVSKLNTYDTTCNSDKYSIPISLSETEKQMFIDEMDKQYKLISYNFKDKTLDVCGNDYEYSGYNDNNVSTIKRKIILTNHKEELTKSSKAIISSLRKDMNVYKKQEDEIKRRLSKWLMLEAF